MSTLILIYASDLYISQSVCDRTNGKTEKGFSSVYTQNSDNNSMPQYSLIDATIQCCLFLSFKFPQNLLPI